MYPVQSDSREVCRAMPLLLLLPSILLLCPVPLVSASCSSGQWQCSDSSCILREKVGGSSARSCLSVCFLSCKFSLLILTVDLPQVCDGRPDCGDLSDEGELCQPRSGTVCPHFLFSCHNQQECVSQVQSPFLTSHLTPHTLHSLHLTHFSGDRLQWPTGLQ